MTKDDFIKLYEKNLSGQCSPEERALLERYRDDFTLEEVTWDQSLMGDQSKTGQQIFRKIREGMPWRPGMKIVQFPNTRRVWIPAAAILLALGLAVVYFKTARSAADQIASVGTVGNRFKNDIPPGGNRAKLTLGDGTTIVLDTAKNGEITQQGNMRVLKMDKGQLAYQTDLSVNKPVTYNTISTPRGGQYQVLLPDGSKVWLNAASALRFPTSFTGKERKVELTGEGYFEVAKNPAMPFRVAILSAPGQAGGSEEVEVLGTSFDVMAYNDESEGRVTLLEGAVNVKRAGETRSLAPGQQARMGLSGTMDVIGDADLEQTVAWKNGKFSCRSMDLEDIMRQVARWYDVDVIYESKIQDRYTVTVPRNVPVSMLLRFMEESGGVRFSIEGKQITVLK